MPFLLPLPLRVDPLQHFAYKDEVFSPEECDQIIALGDTFGWQRGSTLGGEVTDARRRSDVSWIHWRPQSEDFIWEKLAHWIASLNAQFFGFDLSSFSEALQITRYRSEEKGFYSWHQDFGPGQMSIRKLSFVVQLTDPAQYTGGELELFMAKIEKNIAVPKTRGSVIVFPAYEPHRVSPMKTGTRHSLVGWVSGVPFR